MSIGYSIYIKVELEFNIENIKQTLEKGTTVGFEYGELVIKPNNLCEFYHVSIDTILINIQNALSNNDIFIIRANIENTSTDLFFSDSEGYVGITFMGMSPEWSKQYANGTLDLDIQRYAHVMFNFINDYQILAMNIEKD